MRLLLDTHVAIWALTEPEILPSRVRDLIADADNAIYVSAASVWEIAITFALGKPSAPPFSGTDAVRYFREAGYLMLPISVAHAAAVEDLPPIHSDPFDRLIVAQALAEPLRLVTRDSNVARYSDTVIAW